MRLRNGKDKRSRELRKMSNFRAARRRKLDAEALEWKIAQEIVRRRYDESGKEIRRDVIECFHDGGDHRFLRLKINGVPHRIRTAGQVDRSLRVMMAEGLEKTDGK